MSTCRSRLLALSYIHSTLKLVHRDLKLQNWLYPDEKSSDDSLKLIDFGFSHFFTPEQYDFIMTSGTIDYLAPEMLQHGYHTAGEASNLPHAV